VPEPNTLGAVAAGVAEAAKGLRHLATADPIRMKVCETVIIHEAPGWRWDRRMALHRFADGRLEQKLIRSRSAKMTATRRLLLVAVGIVLGLAGANALGLLHLGP
jgi:hypothetical protein